MVTAQYESIKITGTFSDVKVVDKDYEFVFTVDGHRYCATFPDANDPRAQQCCEDLSMDGDDLGEVDSSDIVECHLEHEEHRERWHMNVVLTMATGTTKKVEFINRHNGCYPRGFYLTKDEDVIFMTYL